MSRSHPPSKLPVLSAYVRHGNVPKNTLDLHGSDIPIELQRHSDEGVDQMQSVGRNLAGLMICFAANTPDGYTALDFTHIDIFAPKQSPRCIEAAFYIAGIIHDIGRSQPAARLPLTATVHTESAIDGYNLGSLSGLSGAEQAVRNKSYREGITLWRLGWLNRPPQAPDGENLRHFMFNILQGLERIEEVRRSAVAAIIVQSSSLTAIEAWLNAEEADIAPDGLPIEIPDAPMQQGSFRAYLGNGRRGQLVIDSIPPHDELPPA